MEKSAVMQEVMAIQHSFSLPLSLSLSPVSLLAVCGLSVHALRIGTRPRHRAASCCQHGHLIFRRPGLHRLFSLLHLSLCLFRCRAKSPAIALSGPQVQSNPDQAKGVHPNSVEDPVRGLLAILDHAPPHTRTHTAWMPWIRDDPCCAAAGCQSAQLRRAGSAGWASAPSIACYRIY